MNYCLIEDGKIIDGPRELPSCWKNISGLNLLDEKGLIEKGWYPVIEEEPDYDPGKQRLDAPTLEITDTAVIQRHKVIDYTAEELAGQAQAIKDAMAVIVKENLREIDISSIRSMREWIAAQPTAPQFIKDHETRAQTERAKLK